MTTPQPPRGPAPDTVASASSAAGSASWSDERRYLLDGIGPRRQAFDRALVGTLVRVDAWLRQHWLALVNAGIGAFIGIAVLAPVLRAFGLVAPSQSILSAYHIFCAQTPSHSIYIAGHQVCLCERCLAIYSSLLLGRLLLAILRDRGIRVVPLRWQWWALTMLPMALDGGTQLFGWRESDLFLRLLTGALFGLGTAWFGLAQIQASADPPPTAAPAYRNA